MSQKFELIETDPVPFKMERDNNQLWSAWFTFIFSFLAGGWAVFGYSPFKNKLTKQKPENEYMVKAGPYYIKENIPPRAIDKLKRPERQLTLYEFEMCPFCRKVREVVDYLDLNVLIKPCPKEGKVWRPELLKRGGKAQFPYLVDPNTGKEMYESDAIIKYLMNTYGPGERYTPILLRLGRITILLALYFNFFRNKFGIKSRVGTVPDKPLIAYVYEGSPFSKLAQEALCELEIPYHRISVARGSPKRQEVYSKYGHFQAPLLEDPNTGKALFESKAVVAYLNKNYSKKTN